MKRTERKKAGVSAVPNTQGPSTSGVFSAGEEQTRRAGWTLAEQYTHDGFAYRLLRRPIAHDDCPPQLTQREECAVRLACEGHTNKSIAQVMNVSPSTVGVLLYRASTKLKAKSRSTLLSNYEQHKAALSLKNKNPGEDQGTDGNAGA